MVRRPLRLGWLRLARGVGLGRLGLGWRMGLGRRLGMLGLRMGLGLGSVLGMASVLLQL
jgi:hypothetical protein